MFGPLRVRGANKEEAEKLARELLAKVGLAERAHHYPSELLVVNSSVWRLPARWR
ncbi:Glutamate transport ATP-binding protein [Klebsiella pneumoniae IS22]|nr:Glutamate transport ATP-binding protein [Klebsiella pneumoniae IS22]